MRGVGGSRVITTIRQRATGRISVSLRHDVLATLVAIDISWQTLARLPAGALETDIVPTVIAITIGGLVTLGLAPIALALLFYAYLVYVLTPQVFPDRVRHVTERWGFRLIAVGYTIASPLFLFTPGLAVPDIPFVVLFVPIAAYLLGTQRRTAVAPDGYPVALTDAFIPTEDLESDFPAEPQTTPEAVMRWGLITLFSLTALLVTVVTFGLLGGVLSLLYLMYPVPELLLLGWLLYRRFWPHRPPDTPEGDIERFDLETRLVTTVRVATTGLKGALLVIHGVVGLVIPAVVLWLTVYMVSQLDVLIPWLATADGPTVLEGMAGLISTAVYGTYGVWYWTRIIARLPHALAAWHEGLPGELKTPVDLAPGPLLTRPPGGFLPVMLLLLAWAFLRVHPGWPTDITDVSPLLAAWAIGLSATIWSVYRGLVGQPQPAGRDIVAVPAAYVIHLGGLAVWADVLTGDFLLGRFLTGQISLTAFGQALQGTYSSLALIVIVTPVVFYVIPDIMHTVGTTDRRRYAALPFLGALSVITTLLALRLGGFDQLLLTGIAGLFLVVIAYFLFTEIQTDP